MNKRGLAVAVINHGCKLNQYEGETLENDFSDLGFRITDLKKTEHPDIVIVNTCTVTGTSDRKSRASIYKAIANKKALTLKPNDPRLKESLIKVISRQAELEAGYE